MRDLRPGPGPSVETEATPVSFAPRARRRRFATLDELLDLPPGRLEQTLLRLEENDVPLRGEPDPAPAPARRTRPSHRQPLSLYLSEIAEAPLLSPDEEYRLARTVEIAFKRARLRLFLTDGGLAAARPHLGDPPGSRTPTAEARRRLILRIEALDLPPETITPIARAVADPAVDARLREYERALNRMVRSNLRLAVSIAQRYRGRGAPLLDMIQDANAGLLRAASLFRPRRGWRFSTYAVWWIRQSILQGLGDYATAPRLPAHVLTTGLRLRNASRELAHALGREPRPDEAARAAGVPLTTARRAFRALRHPGSLDRPPLDGGERTLGDLLPAEPAPAPEPRDDTRALRLRLDGALAKLPAKEREILRLRYGLGPAGVVARPLVARRFGITTERVRQIEVHAARKLRDAHRYGRLESFL